MIKEVKQTFQLLIRSWKSFILLDIIFKVVGTVILFPFCQLVLGLALRWSHMYYLATQNYRDVVHHPLMLLGILIIILIFLLFGIFEMSCLYLCLHQSCNLQPLGLGQLLHEGFRGFLRVFQKKNIVSLPIFSLSVPIFYFYMLGTDNNYIAIGLNILRDVLKTVPGRCVLVIVILLFITGICCLIFQGSYFFVGQQTIRQSTKSSLHLVKRRFFRGIRIILGFAICIAGVSVVISGIVSGIVRIVVVHVVAKDAVNAIFWTILSRLATIGENILVSFMIMGICAGSYVTYQEYEKNMGRALPIAKERKKKPKASKNGIVPVLVAISLVTMNLAVDGLSIYWIRNNGLTDGLFEEQVAIFAHRGDTSSAAPENTLPAFRKAVESGADYLELDVQLSKDDVPIILHDSNFKRTCGVNKNVWDLTLAQIREINVGNKYGSYYNGTKIPTLREVLELYAGKIRINVELKMNSHGNAKKLAAKTIEVIEEVDCVDSCVIQSFDYQVLTRVKEIQPNLLCGYILEATMGSYEVLPDADFFSMKMAFITSDAVERIHMRGKKILAWTIDTQPLMEKALKLNVDGIITNNPILAREVIYGPVESGA